MCEVQLRPSDIHYTQSTISNTFKDGCRIGILLDDIVVGRCFASAIKKIEVTLIDGHWYTFDNRRLWVFKHLEAIGVCPSIYVKVSKQIQTEKLTTTNNGTSVKIRNGTPGGSCYKQMQILDMCPSTKTTVINTRNSLIKKHKITKVISTKRSKVPVLKVKTANTTVPHFSVHTQQKKVKSQQKTTGVSNNKENNKQKKLTMPTIAKEKKYHIPGNVETIQKPKKKSNKQLKHLPLETATMVNDTYRVKPGSCIRILNAKKRTKKQLSKQTTTNNDNTSIDTKLLNGEMTELCTRSHPSVHVEASLVASDANADAKLKKKYKTKKIKKNETYTPNDLLYSDVINEGITSQYIKENIVDENTQHDYMNESPVVIHAVSADDNGQENIPEVPHTLMSEIEHHSRSMCKHKGVCETPVPIYFAISLSDVHDICVNCGTTNDSSIDNLENKWPTNGTADLSNIHSITSSTDVNNTCTQLEVRKIDGQIKRKTKKGKKKQQYPETLNINSMFLDYDKDGIDARNGKPSLDANPCMKSISIMEKLDGDIHDESTHTKADVGVSDEQLEVGNIDERSKRKKKKKKKKRKQQFPETLDIIKTQVNTNYTMELLMNPAKPDTSIHTNSCPDNHKITVEYSNTSTIPMMALEPVSCEILCEDVLPVNEFKPTTCLHNTISKTVNNKKSKCKNIQRYAPLLSKDLAVSPCDIQDRHVIYDTTNDIPVTNIENRLDGSNDLDEVNVNDTHSIMESSTAGDNMCGQLEIGNIDEQSTRKKKKRKQQYPEPLKIDNITETRINTAELLLDYDKDGIVAHTDKPSVDANPCTESISIMEKLDGDIPGERTHTKTNDRVLDEQLEVGNIDEQSKRKKKKMKKIKQFPETLDIIKTHVNTNSTMQLLMNYAEAETNIHANSCPDNHTKAVEYLNTSTISKLALEPVNDTYVGPVENGLEGLNDSDELNNTHSIMASSAAVDNTCGQLGIRHIDEQHKRKKKKNRKKKEQQCPDTLEIYSTTETLVNTNSIVELLSSPAKYDNNAQQP